MLSTLFYGFQNLIVYKNNCWRERTQSESFHMTFLERNRVTFFQLVKSQLTNIILKTRCLTFSQKALFQIYTPTSVIRKPTFGCGSTFFVSGSLIRFPDQFPSSICRQFSETSKSIGSRITRESSPFSVGSLYRPADVCFQALDRFRMDIAGWLT